MKYLAILILIFLAGCTEPIQKGCTLEAKVCPDGSTVGRIGANCEFAPCPEVSENNFCTQDKMECPDGSTVGRIPPDCNFAPCPTEFDEGCQLMDDEQGRARCVGCAGGICTDPGPGWKHSNNSETGIPYNCIPTPQGCELVQ